MRTPSVLFSPHAIAGLCLTLTLSACGGGDITLPPDGEPATIEVLDGDGQTGKVGLPLTNPLVVGVFDARGRPVAGATVIFEFSQAGPDAAVVPAQKTTNSEGVADAQLVLGTTVGTQTGQVRVAVPDGRDPILAPFSAVALSENANTMEAVAGLDQTGHVSQLLDDRLVVEVTDGFGNPVPGVPITWTAIGGGTVSEGLVPTDQDGRSRVDRTLGPAVGQQSTEARSDGLAGSPVIFTHTAVAGDASRLTVVSGNGQTAEAGTLLPEALVVRLVDAEGNGVPNTAVTWVIASGGGSVGPQNTTTDEDGRTSAQWTLGPTLGEQRADAVVSGVGVATFRATAASAAPPSLFVRTQPSTSARNGVPLGRQPVVQLHDGAGNDVATAGVEVTVSLNGGGELGGTLRRSTDATGKATFDDLFISGDPGPRILVFQAIGYAQVQSDPVVLEAIGTTTTITGDTPDPSLAGGTVTVSFRVASDGPIPTGTVTVSDGAQSCNGTLSNGAGSCTLDLMTVGSRTLTATYSGGQGLNGSSDTEPHTVTPAAPSNQPPTAEFATSCDELECRFEDQSDDPDGRIEDRQWSFGDGNAEDDDRSPRHEYSSGGTYQVSLRVTDDDGATATVTHSVTVSEQAASTSTSFEVDNPDPTVPGQVFTVTLSVRSDDATPEGTATVSDGVNDCVVQIVEGRGSCLLALFTVGARTLTATFQGNAGFATSSANEIHRVNPPPQPNQPPSAAFTFQCDELDCDFESQSTDGDGRIEDYSWTFGDGGDSDDDDPNHEYQAAGTYQVTLAVRDNDGATGTTTQSVTVAENPPPNQSPTATFTESCTDLTCSFNSAGSGDPDGTITYSWTFGDGGVSSEPNPSHSYASGGTYTVTLEVRDAADATDDATRQVTVSPANQPPTAAFTPPGCTVGQPCQFTDASDDTDGEVVTRAWTFQDGTPASSDDTDPSVTFASEGDKTVTLTVTDDDGASNTATQTVTVAAAPSPAPGSLGIRNQPPESVESGDRLDPEIELRDADGNEMEVEGVPVSVRVANAVGEVTLAGETTRVTDPNGRARFEDLTVSGDVDDSFVLAFSATGFASVDSQRISIEAD